ncbi:MAG: hypothetical protein GX224_03570 [Thermoplasmatales archaeon]|nr:hypothetical protein [Thermoplasmatales archaeon]
MARGLKLNKFIGKYGLFLSDASNEEIVSVSKELTAELSNQVESATKVGLTMLASTVLSLIFLVTFVSSAPTSLSGTEKSVVFLTRILSISLLCFSVLISGLIVSRMSDASSISTVFWRNIRETANDERAHEHANAVRTINSLIGSSKNLIKFAVMTISLAGLVLGFGFVYEMMVIANYL